MDPNEFRGYVQPSLTVLSGSAVDLNWSEHAFRIHNAGFNDKEIAECRELLAFYNIDGFQLIFWGNDWRNPRDAMHFQMGYKTNTPAGRAACEKFIRERIRPDGFSTYRRGGGDFPADPGIPRKLVIPDAGGTFWNDVSQYQEVPINGTYPYPVFSFRTNSGDNEDTLGQENASVAREFLDSGKLALVIPYWFFRPGQANVDLHKQILEDAGLWNHPRTVSMIDVEGDQGKVKGDNSYEINDEVSRIAGWYKNPNRIIGYLNANADGGLWPTRQGINLIVPQYNRAGQKERTPGDISTIRDPQVRHDAIGHQYTDKAKDQGPWADRGIDKNWTPYNVAELLQLFLIEDRPKPPKPVEPPKEWKFPTGTELEEMCGAIGGQFIA